MYDIQDKSQEILDYAKSQVFSMFYSSELGGAEAFVQAKWNRPDQWREFFTIARKEDINLIIASIRMLDKKDMPEDESEFQKYLEYVGKVGFYEFAWVKNGVKYSLTDTADWYKEFKDLLEKKKTAITGAEPLPNHEQSSIMLTPRAMQLLQELKGKPEVEFVQELVAFMKAGGSQDWTRRYKTLESMKSFWSSKGLDQNIPLEEDVSATMRIIEEQAQNMLMEEQLRKEKEILPMLVEECVMWAKSKNMNKMKKGEMMVILAEKQQMLSREGQMTLLQRINTSLKPL
jgi:hypothetical protein